MRPIPLARVRLNSATGQNICGISANTFAVKVGIALDQVVGIVDRLTLFEGFVLFERQGHADVILPIGACGAMQPLEDIKGELYGKDAQPAALVAPSAPVRPVVTAPDVPQETLASAEPIESLESVASVAASAIAAIDDEATPHHGFFGKKKGHKSGKAKPE